MALIPLACITNRATARVVDEPLGFIASGLDRDCKVLLLAPVGIAQTIACPALVTSGEWAKT